MSSTPNGSQKQNIGILGAGNWGTVLSCLAAKNAERVFLYDRDPIRAAEIQKSRLNRRYLPGITLPENVVATHDLKAVFESCRLIFPVIPAYVFREFTKKFAPFATGEHLLVHGTKGLEPVTHLRMSEILNQETQVLRTGALSGPNLAMELAQGKPGATVIASRFNEVIVEVQNALASDVLRVYGNHDLVGVEWAGALKNILAIAAGILNELDFGQNALAMMITRGLAEMSGLLSAMGAKPITLLGLSGVGDVIATCTSPLSRNFRAGQLLAKGRSVTQIEEELAMTIEGFNTIRVVEHLAKGGKLNLPFTNALWMIVQEKRNVQEIFKELMNAPASLEFSGF